MGLPRELLSRVKRLPQLSLSSRLASTYSATPDFNDPKRTGTAFMPRQDRLQIYTLALRPIVQVCMQLS